MKGFPTNEDVEKAHKEQPARWYQKIMKRIADRFRELGGMTPELGRKIGV